MIARLFLSGVLLFVSALAQPYTDHVYGPLAVKTSRGDVLFRDITFWGYADFTKRTIPWFSAIVENRSGTNWPVVEFDLAFHCPGEEGDARLPLIFTKLTAEPKQLSLRAVEYLGSSALSCAPQWVSITFNNGRSDLDVEEALQRERAERAKQEQDEADERRKGDEQHRKEEVALSKLPTLLNGMESILVGSDRKCAEQYAQALALDGLEKRKRLTDLVAFECGFLVPSGIHIVVLKRELLSTYVQIAEGPHDGEKGWILTRWVRFGKTTN